MSIEEQLAMRQSVEADFNELAQVWEASVAATHHFLKPDDFALIKSMITQFFAMVSLVHIQREDGTILGFLGTSEDKVEMLFIHPKSRGTGVGKMLLRHAVDELGIRKVDVNEQNEQAVGFYKHMGFAAIGRSEVDGMGKPYPLLHLEMHGQS